MICPATRSDATGTVRSRLTYRAPLRARTGRVPSSSDLSSTLLHASHTKAPQDVRTAPASQHVQIGASASQTPFVKFIVNRQLHL